MSHVATHSGEYRPCATCEHHGGQKNGGVWCDLNKIVCANGAGCAFWSRAPGSDDEPPNLQNGREN